MCKTSVKTNIYYVNICKHEFMKKTWQNYGARSCLRLVLNKLKEMKGPTFIYTPLGTHLKEASKEVSMCASSKEVF
jgi:Mor family transcriptional regulator